MSQTNKKPYKNSKVLLDKKMSMLMYLITLVAAVIARTVQLQNNMNFQTGKYINDSPAKNYAVWVILIGSVLTGLILIIGESRDKVVESAIMLNPMRLGYEKLNKKLSPMSGAVMFLMSFLIIFDIFLELSEVVSRNNELSTEDNPVFAFAGVPVLKWFIYALAIIVIVTFMVMGTNILKNEGVSKGNCVFLSAFPIWKLLQVFAMFSDNQIVGPYSEQNYIMLTSMSSAAFIIFAAKFFGGYESKHTRFWVCMSAYLSSIIAATSTLPRYIIYFTKSYEDRFGMTTPSTSDVGMIFIGISLITVFWSAYEYKDMPKLNLNGNRRWSGSVTSDQEEMESIDETQENDQL